MRHPGPAVGEAVLGPARMSPCSRASIGRWEPARTGVTIQAGKMMCGDLLRYM